MKIFLTGATGYIGNQLAITLANEGNDVTALVRSPEKQNSLHHPNIRLVTGDITNYEALYNAMKDASQVYHVAGYARLWAPDSSIFYAVNVDGTKNVLKAAKELGIKKMVHTSSTAVFGPTGFLPATEESPRIAPFDNDYDLSKHLAEKEVIKAAMDGLEVSIVSPSRVYGYGINSPGNAITNLLKRALLKEWIVLPYAPQAIGNYTYIDDVVSGHIKAMRFGRTGEKYLLGGENKMVREVLHCIRQLVEQVNYIPLPLGLLKVFSQLLLQYKKLIKEDALFTPSSLKRYTSNAAFDSSKACLELNYSITPFESGMAETLSSLKKDLTWLPHISQL